MHSCYFILECSDLFSLVKLSISILFYLLVHRLLDIFLILAGVELSIFIFIYLFYIIR